jgi:outer membrane protein OmpA-like peptidoglycan-associated protein
MRTAVNAVQQPAQGSATLWRCGGVTCPPGTCDHDDELRRHGSGPAPANAPPIVHEVLQSGGSPLPPTARADMERSLGHDFSAVRIHTDARAADSARMVRAHAYTVGRHVVFGPGQFAPGSAHGRQVLAHELVHTLQQGSAASSRPSSLRISDPHNPAEQHAERIASNLSQGGDAHQPRHTLPTGGTTGVLLQRQADINAAPPGLPCVLTTGPGHLAGTDVMFTISSSALSPAAKASIATLADAWTAGGSSDDVMVDGWASTDGTQELNWRLSCNRAEAVKAELVNRGVPAGKITTLAHGESTEFSATNLAANRRAIITRQAAPSPKPPAPSPPPPPSPPPAPVEKVTSETRVVQPSPRTRTKVGVGEEVDMTHSPGAAAWTATAGKLSAANGVTVLWTAPDTAQKVTVTGGAASIQFDVLAPTDVHMDRFGGTGVKHTKDQPDSGMETQPFLLPDTVNFNKVTYHELNVAAVATVPGVYSCNNGAGHCRQPAGGVCPDLAMTATVTAGKGTQAVLGDCVYSGHCGTPPPFTAGSITFTMGYEYKIGTGAFHAIRNVVQSSSLDPDLVTLRSSKAGANAQTTVASPTVAIAACP